jgi:metal-responsive CopG/Arc/MetJ family transcriptional regulator
MSVGPASQYTDLVRVKTSVTLSRDLLARIDRLDTNRSAFLERAARAYLARMGKAEREARDSEILNSRAERLNREALDVLDYQGRETP